MNNPIPKYLTELFGKKKYESRPVITPTVKQLKAIKLPSDLLKFLTLDPQKLDKNHKDALYWVIETDVNIGDSFPSFNNKNTRLVNDKLLRFDFSHFAKMTDEEIREVEKIVNSRVRQNIRLLKKVQQKKRHAVQLEIQEYVSQLLQEYQNEAAELLHLVLA